LGGDFLELVAEPFAESAVDEEVDGRVEGDQEVGDLGDGNGLDVKRLQDVGDHGQHVTQHKHQHHHHQH